jgi:hypothetical protein
MAPDKEEKMVVPVVDDQIPREKNRQGRRIERGVVLLFVIALAAPLLFSCASPGKNDRVASLSQQDRGERIDQEELKPGATKVVNGVEYIYGRNVRWRSEPSEPQYVWVRKDQYSPGLFESLSQSSREDEKSRQELAKRIERLEAELAKRRSTN